VKWLAIAALVIAAACGKGTDKAGDKTNDKANDKPAGGAGASSAPTGPRKLSVSGEIHLYGALNGTFTWKDDLAVDTCQWVDPTNGGALEVTMSDGKDTFISIGATLHGDGKRTTKLSSAKLKLPHASMLKGEGGFEISGEMSKTHAPDSKVTVVFKNATVTGDDQTVTIDGQLDGNCNF